MININDVNNNTVINCKTEEQFEELCNFLALKNSKYKGFIENNIWSIYKQNTCINPNSTGYSDIDYYSDRHISIISFEDVELLPKYWYLPLTDCTDKELEELNKWRVQHSDCKFTGYDLTRDILLLSEHEDKSYFYNSTEHYFLLESWSKNYQKITLQQFYKYKLKQTMDRFPFKLNFENAKRIINIACQTWKSKLVENWSKDLLLNDCVFIDETFYKEMRKACDPDQNKLFDNIFGVDNLEIDLTKPETIDNRNLFESNGISALISVRTSGNLQNKSFWLNDEFNWELKKDLSDTLCLVPTKK